MLCKYKAESLALVEEIILHSLLYALTHIQCRECFWKFTVWEVGMLWRDHCVEDRVPLGEIQCFIGAPLIWPIGFLNSFVKI